MLPVVNRMLRFVQMLERLEQFGCVSHVKTDAVVADEVRRTIGLAYYAEFDGRCGCVAGELPGISQQMVQHDCCSRVD